MKRRTSLIVTLLVSLIGTWNLEMVSERGTRLQRLVVNPDLSGLCGALPIKKIELKDAAVEFLLVMASTLVEGQNGHTQKRAFLGR